MSVILGSPLRDRSRDLVIDRGKKLRHPRVRRLAELVEAAVLLCGRRPVKDSDVVGLAQELRDVLWVGAWPIVGPMLHLPEHAARATVVAEALADVWDEADRWSRALRRGAFDVAVVSALAMREHARLVEGLVG